MCDVICDKPSLLQMISRFGIPLGVGDQTVRQVCEARGVDTPTFWQWPILFVVAHAVLPIA